MHIAYGIFWQYCFSSAHGSKLCSFGMHHARRCVTGWLHDMSSSKDIHRAAPKTLPTFKGNALPQQLVLTPGRMELWGIEMAWFVEKKTTYRGNLWKPLSEIFSEFPLNLRNVPSNSPDSWIEMLNTAYQSAVEEKQLDQLDPLGIAELP